MRRSGKTRKLLLDDGWKIGKIMLGVGSGDENRMISFERHDNVRSPKKTKHNLKMISIVRHDMSGH